jgi:hypothetical protein
MKEEAGSRSERCAARAWERSMDSMEAGVPAEGRE